LKSFLYNQKTTAYVENMDAVCSPVICPQKEAVEALERVISLKDAVMGLLQKCDSVLTWDYFYRFFYKY